VILVVDHYDSFTYNLVQLIESLGADTTVVRSDERPPAELIAMGPQAVVLSPGPGHPRDAGCFPELLAVLPAATPLLGVCLGHQALGEAFGGEVVRAPIPVHGKLARIEHRGETIFRGIEGPFWGVRYHSLVVRSETMPECLTVTAAADGLVMGISHRSSPAHGVQFHPESISSEHGPQMIENFLALAALWNGGERKARHYAPALAQA